MRQGKVFYKDYLAGIISETDEGEYIFQYDGQYINDHPDEPLKMPHVSKFYNLLLLSCIGNFSKIIVF